MDNPLRRDVAELADFLAQAGEIRMANRARTALDGDSSELESYLASNELWGGAGSVADQACGADRSPSRRRLESLLIRLGRGQVSRGIANPRTTTWIEAFERWTRGDI